MNEAKTILREEEGLRLKAYPDPATKGDPWTNGYGHTKGVKKGDVTTIEQAEAWLEQDMEDAYSIVDNAVKVPLTRQQRDALMCFVFNVGHGKAGVKDGFVVLKSGKPSTMLRLLNAGDYLGAAGQFDLWVNAAGIRMPGLIRRRKREKALFLSGTGISPEPIPSVKENEMLPLAGSILVNALPTLITKLPEIATIFKKPDVAARNVEAVAKVGEIIMQSTGATNMQEAVEKIDADLEVAHAANEALRANRAEVVDLMERVNTMEQGNIKAARESNANEPFMIETKYLKLKFIHILSLAFMGFAGAFASIHFAEMPAELKGAIITLMIIGGWNGVKDYWMGSSSGSDRKTDIINKRSE